MTKDQRLQAAANLAVDMQTHVAGRDGATVVLACCWLLAGVVVQAEDERGTEPADTFRAILSQLQTCVASLESLKVQH